MSQIFASPPEPLFNLKGHQLSDGFVEDVFKTLVDQNHTGAHQQLPTHFNHGKIAACILLTCDHFQQQHETRYIAIQLAEKFLDAKCKNYFKKITSSQLKGHEKVLLWKKFCSSLRKQSFLYSLTCVQLASKICSHFKVMSSSKSRQFLQRASELVTTEKMMRYELEVMQTIDYEFPITSPLTYLEAMLEILGSKKNLSLSVKLLHNMCLRLLDLAYLKRRVIYSKLFEFTVGGPCTASHRSKFVMVENDDFLLAASVIEAAAYLSHREIHGQVLSHLSNLTQIPKEDILDLATVLVETADL